ncbi:16571_t:CDS:2 [Entrophospora sp. SA101]|nr:16571_t:CDS:2 [Entrophospora sp. SA101]
MYYINQIPIAYLEIFVSPTNLDSLILRIEKDPNITYYAVNKQGDLKTNTQSDGPNAVTWGVFSGKEIIQPTVVEAISFMAWKTVDIVQAREPENLTPNHKIRLKAVQHFLQLRKKGYAKIKASEVVSDLMGKAGQKLL